MFEKNRHLRHIEGQFLDLNLIDITFKNYDKKNIFFPVNGKLNLPNEDKYDDFIAVWVDYFNKKLNLKSSLDPNVSVALGVRWLAYKKSYAEKVLKREVTSDEVIQVYKGILNDKSKRAIKIMEKYRMFYGKLKKK